MMKRSGIFFLALVAVMFWAGSSFAGKKALSTDDLDRITAAGEPLIIDLGDISADDSSEINITYDGQVDSALTIDTNSQTNLRALVVNNVTGENQLGNAINVISTLGGGATQTNTINQSWGAVRGRFAEITTTSVGESADGGSGKGGLTIEDGGKCVGICGGNVGGKGGDGAVAIAVVTLAIPIYEAADTIIKIDDISTDDSAEVNIDIDQSTNAALTLGTGAQTNLAALIVNNVTGREQVANGVNIASAGGVAINSPSFVLEGIANGLFSIQTNTINQFRGTPINAPRPVAVCAIAVAGPAATQNCQGFGF